MSDHEHDEDVATARVAYPFNPWGHAYNVVTFLAVVAGNLSSFLHITAQDFASHNNDLIDRRKERAQRRLLWDDLESFEKGDLP